MRRPELIKRLEFARCYVFSEVFHRGDIFAEELASCLEGLPGRMISIGPFRLTGQDQVGKYQASNDAVRDALAGVARMDVHSIVPRIEPGERHIVDRLHDLSRPPMRFLA